MSLDQIVVWFQSYHVFHFAAGGASFKLVTELYPKFFELVVQSFKQRRGFTTSGYWVGKYTMPGFNGVWVYEIYRLIQAQDDVRFYLFAYPNGPDPEGSNHGKAKARCTLWRGAGVLRHGILSAHYLNTDRRSYESGTFNLTLGANTMTGKFFQTDVRVPGKPLHISDTEYVLYRAELPAGARIKMFLRKPPFSTATTPLQVLDDAILRARDI